MLPTLTFSDDEAEAYDRVAATLSGMASNHTRMPSRRFNFLASGVPE